MAAWLLCPYGTKALSTLMRFRFHKWFRCARPFVHTNTPSVFIESASICWKRSWKWIKTKMRIHAYRISVDGRKPIKIKTTTENITGACVCSTRIEFNLRHNVQFYRFTRKRIETVVWTWINRSFAWWRHFTTTTRILRVFPFLCKLSPLLFKPRWDYQI